MDAKPATTQQSMTSSSFSTQRAKPLPQFFLWERVRSAASTGRNLPVLTAWAPRGFAAVPTSAIGPPHSPASPTAAALMGPGPRQFGVAAVAHAAADLMSTIFWSSAWIST